jgi:ubiquinone/menaquinone biosynthesis C-methylase UbiE
MIKKIYNIEKKNWWFTAHRQLVFQFFKGLNFIKNPPKILDLGCGSGVTIEMLKPFAEIIGIDISSESVKHVKSLGFKAVKADAQKIPFSKNSFDLVLAMDIIEHTKNDRKTMSEIHRVLKPNGFCILTVPAFNFFWSNADIIGRHYRRYSKKMIKNLTKNFTIRKITFWNFSLFLPILIIRKFNKVFKRYKKSNFLFDVIMTDIPKLPSFINKILLFILKFENKIIEKNFYLPWGVSLVCILEK